MARSAAMDVLLEHGVLPKDEQVELARRAQSGDRRAAERLVRHHQRFVLSIARKHQGRGLELEDLVSEGNLGLLKGIEKFNADSGNAVTTYCTWWIRHYINRAIADTGSTIRKPNHLVDKARIMWGAIGKIQTAIGHEPTDEEIAHALNVQGRVYDDARKTPFTPEKIAHLKDIFRFTLSSDEAVEGGVTDDLVWGEVHRAEDDTEGEVLNGLDVSRIRELVAGLPERDRDILIRRYGLLGEKPASLRVLAEEFGFSVERARQVVMRAEDILRMRCGVEPNVWREVS